MALERLQCPSCGAHIAVEARSSMFCSYCGARLTITTGACGNAMAVLDSFKEDTGLTAKRLALQHLREESDARRQERADLDRRPKTLLQRASDPGPSRILIRAGLGLACVGLLGAIYGIHEAAIATTYGWDASSGLLALRLSVLCFAAGVGAMLCGNWLVREADLRRKPVEQSEEGCELTAACARLDAEIAELNQRVARLDTEIDQLAREV